jgi:light-regulated signal transduction histidine kinase (bacteriophytochrome)
MLNYKIANKMITIRLLFQTMGLALNKNFQKNISIVQTFETNPKYSGTGLGLAICSRIVENHKGLLK